MAQASVYSDGGESSGLSSFGALVRREDRGDLPPLRTLDDVRLQVAHEVAMHAIAKGRTSGAPPVRTGVCLSFSKSDDAMFLRNVAAVIRHNLLLQDHLFILGTTGASEDQCLLADPAADHIRTVNALLVCGSSYAHVDRARLLTGAKFVGRIVGASDEALRDKQWAARVLDLGASPYDEDALWDVVRKSVYAEGSSTAPTGSKGIDEILQETRARLVRLTPEQAYAELVGGSRAEAPVFLVDIRPAEQRAREGGIGGSLVIERNVLEWRFDPRSSARLEIADRYDLRVIVFCQEGYTSRWVHLVERGEIMRLMAASLAAYALQQLGLLNATDIIGGLKGWRDAGLPVEGAHAIGA